MKIVVDIACNYILRASIFHIFFENVHVIYIFHVIRYHVPNFCSHVSKNLDLE